MKRPFQSEKIITQKIANKDLSTFLVGFDLKDDGTKEYRLKSLVLKLTEVIPKFAFGFHEGQSTDNNQLLSKLTEAAKSIYRIDSFKTVNDIYLKNGSIGDDIEDKYLRRGEFGELILHLLLRDFHSTIPLLSKIHFKDSYGHPVHGFDAVHIEESTKTLWLGESKLYTDSKQGLKALLDDIKEHFKADYLESEFMIISKRVRGQSYIKEAEYWEDILSGSNRLIDKLDKIVIPLLCTYSCDLFNKFSDEDDSSFLGEYISEMNDLKAYFDKNNLHPLKANLKIILILFPVKDKGELVKNLHEKLYLLQKIGE